MKGYFSQFILLISITFLVSCGSLQEKNSAYKASLNTNKPVNSAQIKQALYSQYNDWQGVRYQSGGLTRAGIDCSGFVHITFKSKLGFSLPRTSEMQARLGNEVKKDELRVGDLIFFRTGKISNHVGIYLEKNRFLHASQKKGVTISSLDNAYWKSSYWKSVRL